MTGRGRPLVMLALAGIAVEPSEATATRFLVPEEKSLSAAIDIAAPGDTVSIAPGIYERTPDPFIKTIHIEGRDPADPPVLRRLAAGGVTLRHLRFEPSGLTSANPILLQLLDSAGVEECSFQGFGLTGIDIRDEESDHDWLVTIDQCRFNNLGGAVYAGFVRDGSRVTLHDSSFETCHAGFALVTPARGCPAIPDAEPPPLGSESARVTMTGTRFSGMADVAILAREAAFALDMIDCTIVDTPLGINLERAGARIDRLELRGLIDSSIGIRAISSRLEMMSSLINQHALGIDMTNDAGCERPAGVIGGAVAGFCLLDMNVLALRTTHPVNADCNWWGSLICSEAQEFVEGVTLGHLVDATGMMVIDCVTPVEPSTWSRIKARLHR